MIRGVVIKAATFTSKGEILYSCRHGCGKSYTAAIPKKKAYVKLNASSIPLQVGKRTAALKITEYASGDQVLSWSSSKKNVASVNQYTGEIHATKKLAAPKKTIMLKVGESYKIEGIRRPITASDKLTYRSSKKSVATVSRNGKVKGKKKGSAVITVTALNGKKIKIKVKVS